MYIDATEKKLFDYINSLNISDDEKKKLIALVNDAIAFSFDKGYDHFIRNNS